MFVARTRVCRHKTFVATKIILVAAPANDSFVLRQVSERSDGYKERRIRVTACDSIDEKEIGIGSPWPVTVQLFHRCVSAKSGGLLGTITDTDIALPCLGHMEHVSQNCCWVSAITAPVELCNNYIVVD